MLHREREKQRGRDNPEAARKKSAEWYYSNPEKAAKYRKEKTASIFADPEKRRKELDRVAQWYKENPAVGAARAARRRAAQFRATPGWLTEKDYEEMRKIYEECARISKETGVLHHVDHVIPLRGKKISGLHVPQNLRIITAEENLKKGNKF